MRINEPVEDQVLPKNAEDVVDSSSEFEEIIKANVQQEEIRIKKLRGLIEDDFESATAISSNDVRVFLAKADHASQTYGYRRHIDECLANLDIVLIQPPSIRRSK
jgi:hypothetical protein